MAAATKAYMRMVAVVLKFAMAVSWMQMLMMFYGGMSGRTSCCGRIDGVLVRNGRKDRLG